MTDCATGILPTVARRDFLEDSGSNLRFLSALLSWSQLGPNHQALEIGCGTGVLAEAFSAATGARVCGTEKDEAAWRRARERIDARHLPEGTIPKGELFDLVYCKDVLPMIRDKLSFASSVRSVLKPGRLFLTYMPDDFDYRDKPLYAFVANSEARSRFAYESLASVVETFRATGFDHVHTERLYLGSVAFGTAYAAKHADGFFNNTDVSELYVSRTNGISSLHRFAEAIARYGGRVDYEWERTLVIAR